MLNDSIKTIKISVTVKNGAVIFPDDFDLNVLHKEFHADLILSETDFADKKVFQSLAKETEVEFLPAGSRLLVNISLEEIPDSLRKHVITQQRPDRVSGGFVEIYLQMPQILKLRGTKKAQLLDCPVQIPALSTDDENKIANSINHAYTLISEAFEPWRRSHTANVFQKVYWHNEEQKTLQLLDTLRHQF